MKIIKCEDANEFMPVDGVNIALIGDGATMTFARIRIAPNSILPLHSHPHEQIGICLEGNGLMTSAGVVHEICPGLAWTIPSGEEHMFEALKDPVLVIEVWSPPREDYKKLSR